MLWVALWLLMALAFCGAIYLWRGSGDALDFLTAYIIEQSLSLDNLVVIALTFAAAAVDLQYQHKVLFYGILGVVVMRGVFVFAGVELIAHFHWFLYVLGGLLVVAGARLLRKARGGFDPARSRVLGMARKVLPITAGYQEGRFFTRREGRWFATPLLVVLLTIEITDVFFAVDSVPAVFSVTQDPFIVYTSNIFAVLGLRALYFLLADAVKRFYYLRRALAVVLVFVGVRMLIARAVRIPTAWALVVILLAISVGVVASLFRARKEVIVAK